MEQLSLLVNEDFHSIIDIIIRDCWQASWCSRCDCATQWGLAYYPADLIVWPSREQRWYLCGNSFSFWYCTHYESHIDAPAVPWSKLLVYTDFLANWAVVASRDTAPSTTLWSVFSAALTYRQSKNHQAYPEVMANVRRAWLWYLGRVPNQWYGTWQSLTLWSTTSYLAVSTKSAGSAAAELTASSKVQMYSDCHIITYSSPSQSRRWAHSRGRQWVSIKILDRRLTASTGDTRKTAFLFKRLSVAIQHFNCVVLRDCFIDALDDNDMF